MTHKEVALYGISNCDTVKKAKKWLDAQEIAYHWVDFRKDGIDKAQIMIWVKSLGLDVLINKRGTTWRKLTPEQQIFSSDEEAIELIAQEPTLIKRPVIETDGQIHVGFKAETYETIFK